MTGFVPKKGGDVIFTLGIHTMMLTYQTNDSQAENIIQRYRPRLTLDKILATLTPESEPYPIHIRTPLTYKFYFYICKFTQSNRVYHASGIKVQLAPQELASGCPRTADLYDFDVSTHELLQNAFTSLISHYFGEIVPSSLGLWRCNYIEYSLNLYVDNKAITLKMLDKSSKSIKSRTYKHNGQVSGSRKSNKSEKGRAMTNYDKELQMHVVYDSDDESYRFIRMELQIHKDALYRLRRKYGISASVSDLLNREIAINELATEYKRTYSVGDWFNLRAMQKALQKTDYSTQIQNNLLAVAKKIACHKSIKQTKRKSIDNCSIANINARIRQFNAVFINPIPIPRDDKVKYLPNPIPDEFLSDDEYNERDRFRQLWDVS